MNKLQQLYYKYRLKIISIFTFLVVIIAAINIYFVVEVNVTSNDECIWQPTKITQDSTAIIFRLVKKNGVTWNAGIRDGDQLLKIDNIHLTNIFQAQIILNQFSKGEFADYTVLHNGKILNTKVYIKKLINYNDFAFSILSLIWLLIGALIFSTKPDGLVQKLFFAIGVASVLSSLQVILKAYGLLYTADVQTTIILPIIVLLWSLGYSLLPTLLVYFFWIFPKPFKMSEKNSVKLLLVFIPVVIFLGINTLEILTFITKDIKRFYFFSTMRWLSFFVAFCYLVSWISLIINYRRLKTKKEKKPVFIILASITIALIAIVYSLTIAPALSDSIFNNPEYYMPIVLIVLVPLGFAYSIFKYQLMDVSIVVKNTITYGLATLTLAGIYFFIIYLMGQSISKAIGTEYQGLIAGVFFVVFAIFFQSTKDRFQGFITARFYPEQFAYQKVLVKFSSDVTTLIGLDNILESMKKIFVESLKINKFGIMIKELDNGNLTLHKSVGINNKRIKINCKNLQNYIDEKLIITNNLVIEKENYGFVFPGIKADLDEEQIYTIIPMIIKSKLVGALLFGLKYSGTQFVGKDLELLCATANQSAISIENARLYKSETEKLKIEKELDLARNIQQGLLPKSIPDVDGFDVWGEMVPAMKIGGDYFDLLPVDGDSSKLYVIIGDVSGKGLPASLYMTKVQTMIQFSCTSDKSPKEILIEINKRFYKSIKRDSFITMSIGLFDYKKKTLSYCRAGHMPLITIDDGEKKSYRSQGIGIGLDEGKIFEKTIVQEEIQINSGQVFAFFSDGLTEAMNVKAELYDEERLSSALNELSSETAKVQVNNIWHSIKTFRGKAEPNDDMTLVIVKVK